MPVYVNPSNHPVTVSISQPRVSLFVFPYSWLRSQLPQDAKVEVELDEKLAKPFVALNMLKLKADADRPSARMRIDAAAAAAASDTPNIPAFPADDSAATPVAAQVDATQEEPATLTESAPSPLAELAAKVDRGEIGPEDAAMQAAKVKAPPVVRPPLPPKRKRYSL